MNHDERVKRVADALENAFKSSAHILTWEEAAKAAIAAVFETFEVTDGVVDASLSAAAGIGMWSPDAEYVVARTQIRRAIEAALDTLRGDAK